jgi:DNA-binding NtrC family response regulator
MSSVLIVDDEPPMREILRRWLASAGHETREAPDAETALTLLTLGASDVVLCDVTMPGHDGLWLVQRLRERFPTLAVVLVTAVDTVPPTVSLQGGVVEYLVKPLEPGRLLAAVSRAVEWHEAALARGPEHVTTDPLEEWLGGRRSESPAPGTDRDRDPQ